MTDHAINWVYMLLGTLIGFILSVMWQTRRERYSAIFKKLDKIEEKLDDIKHGGRSE